MNTSIFSENMKKFRITRGMTQEQVAGILNVNSQTVSRWECGTTLPDVLILPKIAQLYAVTVDDFYKKQSVAYENYAQRLSAVYEKTRDPGDFFRCRMEYQKLMKAGELSTADKWNFATIHHFMFRWCRDIALEWYERAIADGPESDGHSYRRARALRMNLMHETGRGDEAIEEQRTICAKHPDSAQEWISLIEAYLFGKKYEEAYSVFLFAIEKFPDNWVLCIHGGDICEKLKKYDDAFHYWSKAGEIGTDFYDEFYSRAMCYANMGNYAKAWETYVALAEKLRADHFDEEAEMAERDAEKMRLKMK